MNRFKIFLSVVMIAFTFGVIPAFGESQVTPD